MTELLSRLDRAGRAVENAVLGVLLAALIVLAVGQILLRELFSTGFVWADEFLRLLVLWLAMVGSIAAGRDDRHIRIDVLSHVLPPDAVIAVRAVVELFAAGICAVIAWQAWRYLGVEAEFEDTVLVDIPAWFVHVIVPLAFVLLAWRFLVLAAMHVLSFGEKSDESAT